MYYIYYNIYIYVSIYIILIHSLHVRLSLRIFTSSSRSKLKRLSLDRSMGFHRAPSIRKAKQVASSTSLTWTMAKRATRFLGMNKTSQRNGFLGLIGFDGWLGSRLGSRVLCIGGWVPMGCAGWFPPTPPSYTVIPNEAGNTRSTPDSSARMTNEQCMTNHLHSKLQHGLLPHHSDLTPGQW